MESLRKVLGYVVLGLIALAAVLGVVFKLTDAGDQFKATFDDGFDFDRLLNFVASWVAQLVCWAIMAVVAILALLKEAKGMEAKALDNKVLKLVVIGAIAEFIAGLVKVILGAKVGPMDLWMGGNSWVLFIFAILVIAAALVRKIVFKDNNLIGKCIAAGAGLLMFIAAILWLGDVKGSSSLTTTWVFFLIAYIAATASPLLSSDLK